MSNQSSHPSGPAEGSNSDTIMPSSASLYTLDSKVTLNGQSFDDASIFSTETITGPPVVPKLPYPIPDNFDYGAFHAAKAEAQKALAEWKKKEQARREEEANEEAERTGVRRKWTDRKDSKRKAILKQAVRPVGWFVKGNQRENVGGGQTSIYW